MIGTKKLYDIQFVCAVHTSHFSARCFGHLNGKGSHTTTRTIDQHVLSWLNLSYPIDGCRMHFDQDFIVFWRGRFYFLEFKNIRRSILVVQDCFHMNLPNEIEEGKKAV